MSMFAGVNIMEVAEGTEIAFEGEVQVVTDENAVFKGRDLFVTTKVFAKLKEHGEPRNG